MAARFERGSRSRAVLATIVANPAYGPSTLSHPATLFTLLAEYLPDSPREAGPLLAAAQVDIPGALRGHIAVGMSRRMAIQLAAASLAARTDFSDQACLWAVSEFALALGLATTDQLAGWLSPLDITVTGPIEAAPASRTGLDLLPVDASRRREPRRPPPRRPPGFRIWLASATVTCAVALVGAAVGIALLSSQHPAAQRRPVDPSVSHASPDSRTVTSHPSTASPSPRTASPRRRSASVHPSARSAASSRVSTPSPSPSTPSPLPPDPALLARDYVADVNGHDWPSLWQLGGGNVMLTYQPNPGPLTYSQMVAQFQHTVWVTITALTSAGDSVTMHASALDSAGVTQYYELKFVINDGRIVSGSQYLLGP